MLPDGLLDGPPDAVLDRILALPVPQRRALVPSLEAAVEHTAATVRVGHDRYETRDPDLAVRASTALLAAIPPGRDPGGRIHPPGPDVLGRLLRDRSPAERTTLAEHLLESIEGWRAVRAVVAAGHLPPVRPARYWDGWFVWSRRFSPGGRIPHSTLADRLRAEPGAVDELYDVIATDGGEIESLASHDKYSAPDQQWSSATIEFAGTGELDRDRLLDLTLTVLAGDVAAFRAQWYTALHEALAPTVDERARRQLRYARLCSHAVPRIVSFAVSALWTVHQAGLLDADAVLPHLAPVAAGRGAGAAKIAVRLATAHADRRGADEVFRAAATHATAEVRKPALARIDAAPAAPALVTAAEYPEPAPLPWAESHELRAPLEVPATPAALAEACAALLADLEQPDLLLAVLDGAHRCRGDLTAALAPLVRRARAMLGHWPPLADTVAGLVCGLAGADTTQQPVGAGWMRPIRHRIAALLAGTAVPVGAPTHRGGWLDPVVLVERLLEHPSPPEDDLVDGLLRLAPDTRVDAAAAAAELTGPYAGTVCWALGGAGQPVPGWVGLAAARARHPQAADPAAVLHGAPPEQITWLGSAHEDSRGFVGLDVVVNPRPVRADVPWLGMLFATGRPMTMEPTDHTAHRAVSSPYDRDVVESWTARLLVESDEVGDRSERFTLPPYLERPRTPGVMGTLAIAAALATTRNEAARLGIDVAISLFDARVLGPRTLGRALADLAPALVPTRLASRLATVAAEHPIAVHAVLDALLPRLDRSRRGVFALLELAADLADRGAGTPSPETRAWLGGFGGASKAAKAAARLTATP